jgi:transcriptional regulator with XRE-family HTH domain
MEMFKPAWPLQVACDTPEGLREQAGLDRERASDDLTEAVLDAMRAKHLTHADVARRLGISRPAVTQLLGGETFTFLTAAQLSLAVGLRFLYAYSKDDSEVVCAGTHSFDYPTTETAQQLAVSPLAHHEWAIEETACSTPTDPVSLPDSLIPMTEFHQ